MTAFIFLRGLICAARNVWTDAKIKTEDADSFIICVNKNEFLVEVKKVK